MAQRFTDHAQQVLLLAQTEARDAGTDYVGPGHLLLAVLRLGEGVAWEALAKLAIDVGALRKDVAGRFVREPHVASGELPFNPAAKRVLERSVEFAQRFEHRHIGTEHLLLALVSEPRGYAAPALANAGVTLEAACSAVLELLDEEPSADMAALSPSVGSSGDAKRALPESFFERIVRVCGACPKIDGCLVTVASRIGRAADVQVVVLLRPGSDYEEAWSQLKERVDDLDDFAVQFKLPLQRPVFKAAGTWRVVEDGKDVITL